MYFLGKSAAETVQRGPLMRSNSFEQRNQPEVSLSIDAQCPDNCYGFSADADEMRGLTVARVPTVTPPRVHDQPDGC